MRRVTGGSLPAEIWKQFMTAATPLVQPESTAVAAAPGTDAAQTTGAGSPGEPPTTQALAEQAPAGTCDPQACAGVYRSFRAADCTYQPYSGAARRTCELGDRRANASQPAAETTGAGPGMQAQCHVDACSRIYSSFDPADCTYQPYGGGSRQLCTR
jgi:membrane peptidoglycan carboxypeptidase